MFLRRLFIFIFSITKIVNFKNQNKIKCGKLEDKTDYNYDLCSVPSAFFQLCEMGSEAWFFCLAFDMAVSVSNPLSSFKNRRDIIYYLLSFSIYCNIYIIFSATLE